MAKSRKADSDTATDEQKANATSATDAGAQSSAAAASESAGIVGAGSTASGMASDNQGTVEVTHPAEADAISGSGPLAALDDGGVEARAEHAKGLEFTRDEQGRGGVNIVQKIAAAPSSDYPGRDKALAATDGGRLMPANLDAILRARFAGTQVPGDAQLMTTEEIDGLKKRFVDDIELFDQSAAGAGTRFVEDEGDPNAFRHENEINPNTPTNERVEKD